MTSSVAERLAGWTADASTFGARLALIRQRMGWGNVKEAATACDLPVETWRSWERDNREPHRLTVIAKQIAAKTGCDYRWLALGPDGGGGDTGRYSPPADGAGREYFQPARTIATVGDSPPFAGRRPVTRTKPRAGRPLTPVAV